MLAAGALEGWYFIVMTRPSGRPLCACFTSALWLQRLPARSPRRSFDDLAREWFDDVR